MAKTLRTPHDGCHMYLLVLTQLNRSVNGHKQLRPPTIVYVDCVKEATPDRMLIDNHIRIEPRLQK